LRSHLTEKLQKLGLAEDECHLFGQGFEGDGAMFAGSVIYYRGHGRIVAIDYSHGDGTGCFIGSDDASPLTYKEWPSLWVLLGMASDNDDDDDLGSVDAYLDQFPKGPDAMLAFVAEKLGQLLPS
jgi:hypothetical protein